MKEAIDGCFRSEGWSSPVAVIKDDGLKVLIQANGGPLFGHSVIMDCTASSSFLNALVSIDLPESIQVWRSEMAFRGRLGFWLWEGPGRNPRVDDLQMILFSEALRNPELELWLRFFREQREREVGPALDGIEIGVSCRSATLRVSDSLVSYHAACMAHAFLARAQSGEIGISSINVSDAMAGAVRRHVIGPTVCLIPSENPSWQIRVVARAVSDMRAHFNEFAPRETGGVLLGRIHWKRRIIYVTDVLGPPKDSLFQRYIFRRGTKGLNKSVAEIAERTGSIIQFVGEWHTHPKGSGSLSSTDREAVRELRIQLDPGLVPTLVLVVAQDELMAHLFLPEGEERNG